MPDAEAYFIVYPDLPGMYKLRDRKRKCIIVIFIAFLHYLFVYLFHEDTFTQMYFVEPDFTGEAERRKVEIKRQTPKVDKFQLTVMNCA